MDRLLALHIHLLFFAVSVSSIGYSRGRIRDGMDIRVRILEELGAGRQMVQFGGLVVVEGLGYCVTCVEIVLGDFVLVLCGEG